jgi:hypothetical protein
MKEIFLNRFLNQKVKFMAFGDYWVSGEVSILGDGKVGIVTAHEVFSSMDIKKVRRVK